MKKENKGVMTRRSYKNKAVLKKVKKGAILLFVGFILGVLYSNIFIYSDLIAKAETNKSELEVQIPYQSEKASNSPKKEGITEVFKDDACYLDEVSCKIKEIADSYEVDWRLAVAISKHETGIYTSVAFKEMNNVGGNFRNGHLMNFSNLDDGIEFFVNNLKTKYIDLGLDTIEEISVKYAPIGAENDPNNLNQYWVSGVYKYYKELGGK